ncbi:MAG TPA: HlyD family efflux transporter periplasmic adaptor subunit [Thermoanaerobaculia bacterium]|nr:HlyD family efflux transporter periplasmic adaptor subunit [Thermoanaerobaculia bacterium]
MNGVILSRPSTPLRAGFDGEGSSTWHAGRSLAALGMTLAFLGCGRSDDVATFRVTPLEFTRRVPAEGTLEAMKATPLTAPHNASVPLKVVWVANDGTLLRKGDAIVRFDATDFENLLLTGREARTTATNKLTKTNAEATSTRTNLRRDATLAQKELEAAQRFLFDDAEIFSRYARIEAEVDQNLALHRKSHAEQVLGVRESLVRVERDLLAIEDRKAGLKIREAEDGLQALQVVAPHDGILVLQRNWRGDMLRVGDTVWRGFPIGEIPELQSMKAEVFVLEADAAGLAVGQKATVALESHPDATFNGKISSVDKVARPRIPRQPVQYFGVTVELDRSEPKRMKPGTRVRAVVEVESQSNAFAIPRQALFEKEGKKFVYRRKDGKFERVPVTIGSSTAGRVVVTRGVIAGDEIALEDPTMNDERGTMNDERT